MGWMRSAGIAVLATLAAGALTACSHGKGKEGTFVSQESGGFNPFRLGKGGNKNANPASIGVVSSDRSLPCRG